MGGIEKVFFLVAGVLLLVYGFHQRAKGRESGATLKRDMAQNEGYWGIGIGAVLLLAVVFS